MEKASSNKTPLLTKIMNMDVWVVVALLNQPFINGSYTGFNFQKTVKGATKLYFTHYLCVVIILTILVYLSLHFLLVFFGKRVLVFLCFKCFLSVMSFEFDVIFTKLQHFYIHCLYKCHMSICDFVPF